MSVNANVIREDFLGYRPEELVGQGGMGVVYRARDLRLKRTVALKLMAPELAGDERFRERFAREAELAMSLEHPNVVPIHDAGELDGRLYLVMRFVEGSDLRAVLRTEGALEPRRALAIVAQVAHALDAAHAKGLVHRDVKPSNVLLDADEHVYLADFGLTRTFGERAADAADGRSLGTPAYLAPEQIGGRAIDGRADVYSLGCLLYECLTGAAPFAASSRLAVAWAHLEEDPPRASDRNWELPEAIDGVIRKAMAKEPVDRHPTCAELVADAEAALGLGRRSRWRPRALVLAAAVVVAAALAAALVARGGHDSVTPLAFDHNKLVRIDPRTNRIAGFVDVGKHPGAAAVAGDTVWVYNVADESVSEVDARTNEVRGTTKISAAPTVTTGEASVLAADAGGAWLVGYSARDTRWLLTRILPGGEKREHELGAGLDDVVAAGGAVWVLAHQGEHYSIIRVDPRTGTATRRVALPKIRVRSGLNGLAAGGGFVWATDEDAGTLYRIDPATGAVRARDLGGLVLRPVFGFGRVWVCALTQHGAVMMRVDPRTLRNTLAGRGLPAEEGHYAAGHGSVWRHDVPSGTLMRFDPKTGDLAGLVRVFQGRGAAEAGVFVTSIASGAEAVWLTIA